jgi:hypothetical protein
MAIWFNVFVNFKSLLDLCLSPFYHSSLEFFFATYLNPYNNYILKSNFQQFFLHQFWMCKLEKKTKFFTIAFLYLLLDNKTKENHTTKIFDPKFVQGWLQNGKSSYFNIL